MSRTLIIVAVLAAFACGMIVSASRPRKKSDWEVTQCNVQAGRALARDGLDVIEKLEAGDTRGAETVAAMSIVYYRELCQAYDNAPEKPEMLRRIETLIVKSPVLKEAIERHDPPKKSPK